jgi:C1A family cysteine protease
MRTTARIGLSVLLSFFLVAPAKPQDTTRIHGLGALAPSQDQIKGFPKLPPSTRRAALPPKADISAFMPPVGDQGRMGSCVAWSSGYGLRSYYLAKINKLDVTNPKNVPSPAYIFNHGSAIDQAGTPCAKRGMLISIALEVMRAGVVSLAEMPYNDQTCGPPPDFEMQARAKEFRIDGWAFIDPESIDAIKEAIAGGDAVVFGIKVSKSFDKHLGDKVYSREPTEEFEGGHAMVLVGYDDERQAFRLQNSWGRDWGDHGRAWLSYNTFKRDATDAYIVRAGKGG